MLIHLYMYKNISFVHFKLIVVNKVIKQLISTESFNFFHLRILDFLDTHD